MAHIETTHPNPMEGGCQCGQVRYSIARARLTGYACHCRECRRQAASAFGVSVPVRAADLTLTGALRDWSRQTDSGNITTCRFCPECGVRILHVSNSGPEIVTLKGGTLDRADEVAIVGHIWVSRKLPWVILDPALPAHEVQPDDLGAWRERMLL